MLLYIKKCLGPSLVFDVFQMTVTQMSYMAQRRVKMRAHLQRILGRNTLKGRQVTNVLIVEPLDFEVKIHVFSTFA